MVCAVSEIREDDVIIMKKNRSSLGWICPALRERVCYGLPCFTDEDSKGMERLTLLPPVQLISERGLGVPTLVTSAELEISGMSGQGSKLNEKEVEGESVPGKGNSMSKGPVVGMGMGLVYKDKGGLVVGL